MKTLVLFQKIALLAGLLGSFEIFGRDLGQIGPVYPIEEEDMVEFMKRKASERQGEFKKVSERLLKRGKAYASRPPGITLPRTKKYRARSYNPVLVLEHDIRDAKGKILFAKGTTVNPLAVKSMRKTLCFIDADDIEQLQWAHKSCGDISLNKIILVNGNFERAGKSLGRRVYFDQRGYLSSKFELSSVPAVVRQSGMSLVVEDFPVK